MLLSCHPTKTQKSRRSKQSVVDVLCRDQDGCSYIVEMQVAKDDWYKERAQYYASRTFCNQMHKGEPYEKLKEVIFLAFTNFSIFPKKEEYKSEHMILDCKTRERDLDKLSFTFIDLSKFQAEDVARLTLEEKFYYFLKHAPEISPEKLKKLIGKDKVVEQAFHELDRFYWTKRRGAFL